MVGHGWMQMNKSQKKIIHGVNPQVVGGVFNLGEIIISGSDGGTGLW